MLNFVEKGLIYKKMIKIAKKQRGGISNTHLKQSSAKIINGGKD